ncbi:MAG: DUF4249 domain-containing protein [Chitinophagales bacterium]
MKAPAIFSSAASRRLSGMMMFTAAVMCSCKETIKLDLQSAAPHIVLEANLSDQNELQELRISKSKAYYDDNSFTAVSGALAILTDDMGLVDTLKEGLTAGRYYPAIAAGIPGHTYHLHVEAEGKTYDAFSTMPYPVELDTIGIISLPIPGREAIKTIGCVYQDPAAYTNYYHFVSYRNGKRSTSFRVASDQFTNGNHVTTTVGAPDTIISMDTISLELQAVDKPIYDYFRELSSITSTRNQPAAPANPKSNWTNDALGYFSAHTSRKKTTIAP